MPSTEGSPGDYLSINSTGFGAVISFTVVDQKITAATVETSGSGYDTNSYPDIVTTGQSHTNPAQVEINENESNNKSEGDEEITSNKDEDETIESISFISEPSKEKRPRSSK